MKNTWTTWLLAGAFVASLQWNLGGLGPGPQEPAGASAGPEPRCAIDLTALGLSEDQRGELERICRAECRLADEHEARAREKLRELRRALAATELDEEQLRALAHELGELRERSLGACVDAVVRVRAILDADQLQSLLVSCSPLEPCGAAEGSCGRPDSTE